MKSENQRALSREPRKNTQVEVAAVEVVAVNDVDRLGCQLEQ